MTDSFSDSFLRFAVLTGAAMLAALLGGCTGAPAPRVDAAAPAQAQTRQLPGSARRYTQAEIEDDYAAPDWYPDAHPPMPRLVSHGDGGRIRACASCHLASGLGRPESANLSGLPAAYQVRQLAEYKTRARLAPGPMHEIAAAMSEGEMQEVSAWFAALEPRRSARVEEADHVPQTTIDARLGMRRVVPGGGSEPLGGRLIEIPEDAERVALRDPYATLVAYVPRGSLALGRRLVGEGAGRTLPCVNCHGADLRGTAELPRLAGLSPGYVLRQLQAFRSGDRQGALALVMKPVVARLGEREMIAIAAYVGSLAP